MKTINQSVLLALQLIQYRVLQSGKPTPKRLKALIEESKTKVKNESLVGAV